MAVNMQKARLDWGISLIYSTGLTDCQIHWRFGIIKMALQTGSTLNLNNQTFPGTGIECGLPLWIHDLRPGRSLQLRKYLKPLKLKDVWQCSQNMGPWVLAWRDNAFVSTIVYPCTSQVQIFIYIWRAPPAAHVGLSFWGKLRTDRWMI